MGLDLRVSNSRCPPLLVGACILLYMILICNWWSLSNQNYDLLNQVNVLEEQMKICCGERDQYTNDKNMLDKSLGQLKIKIDREKTEHENILKKKENSLSMCKSELNSLKIVDASKAKSLEALRIRLEERKQEIKRLHEQIKLITSVTTEAHLQRNQLKKETSSIKNVDDSLNRNVFPEETLDLRGNYDEREEMANLR